MMSQHSRFLCERFGGVTTKRRENSRSSSPILDDNDDMTAANQSRPNEETALFLRAIDDMNVQLPF